MHAAIAFVNGAGEERAGSLALLNTLLASPPASSLAQAPALDRRKPKNEKQAEEEGKADTASKPGGFHNDPDNPKNPNEVRERHQKKVRP
jgi:hypothetical protein